MKVVRTFLRALNKIDLFRELLEEGGFRLTDRWHMSDLVLSAGARFVEE